MRTAVIAAALGAMACGVPSEGPRPSKTPGLDRVEYRLPADAGAFAPAFGELAGEASAVEGLADVEQCELCHADVVAEWRDSPHARSSFDNPWYRSNVDRYREQVGFEKSRFCGGCHDPVLLVSGRMDAPIDASDPKATAGVTCMVCHGAVDARLDGRGSYILSTDPVPLPRRGDAASLDAHRARVASPTLRSPALCATCHRAFLDEGSGNAHFLPGMDDVGAWRGSAYGGSRASRLEPEPIEAAECTGCHLPTIETVRGGPFARSGESRSHRMPGGQTGLAQQVSHAQHEATTAMLEGAASIDVVAARVIAPGGVESRHLPADGVPLMGGASVAIDVVLRNQLAGHRFPGGVRDTQDTWVELTVTDARGRRVAEAGTDHVDRDDPTTHRLLTGFVDDSGQPEEQHLVHRFAALAFEHTLAPRDAAVVRFEWTVPEAPALPLRVEAQLRHRRHGRQFVSMVCADDRSERAEAFRSVRGQVPLDGCAAQPVTRIASAVVFLGGDQPGEGGAARSTWLRLYEHALGLSHEVQERVVDAIPSLEAALPLAPSPRARAAILALRSTVEGRQGRLEDALRFAADAEREFRQPHPAIDRARGRAYARVWRWPEAAHAYRRTALGAEHDTLAWRDLAQALGSAGDPHDALSAAVQGLALLPRESQLLRSQALALERIGHPAHDAARRAYLGHREPDAESVLRLRCALRIPGCDEAQRPVPTIRMRSLRR